MPITVTGVTLTVNPASRPCPPAGQTFTVTVTVSGNRSGIGGSYDVELFDIQPGNPDLLDSAMNVNVVGGLPTFSTPHTFTLKCDDACEVVGNLGSSGEQKAELQATVTWGTAVPPAPRPSKKSLMKTATCGAGAYRERR
jgi:hypothetical protein